MMQPFTCPQCGHESSLDPWAESARCPRCGFSPPTQGPRLDHVRWANRHTYQPFVDELVGYWKEAHTAEPDFEFETQGVYLPFWVFDGQVETCRIVSGMVTTRKERLGWKSYENLLYPGFGRPTPALLAAVFPFDLKRLAPYEPRPLANGSAKLYTLDVEIVAGQARETMIERSRVRNPQPSGERPQIESQVVDLTCQLILLPLWFARLAARAQTSGVLINGQTG